MIQQFFYHIFRQNGSDRIVWSFISHWSALRLTKKLPQPMYGNKLLYLPTSTLIYGVPLRFCRSISIFILDTETLPLYCACGVFPPVWRVSRGGSGSLVRSVVSRNLWFSGVLALDSEVRFSRCVWSTNAKRFVYHYTLNNNVYTMYMLVLIIISIPNTCYTQYNIILK